MDWKDGGGKWLPMLAEAEVTYSLPTDLLARIAYQECSWREDVILGVQASPAGALGMMQLMPQFFASVRVSTPYSDTDIEAQITEAAKYLASLNDAFHDWKLAVAAYNAGAGNVRKYGGVPPFAETENYVAQIGADVPGGLA